MRMRRNFRKPLNTAIFTVHKLIALGAVIAAAIQTYNIFKNAETQAILIALIVLIGLSVVALFVTGALMSMNEPAYGSLLTIHKVALLLVIIVMVLAIFLLGGWS